MDPVNLAAKLARVSAPWKPHVVGALNGQEVKVAKLAGPFVWHHHEHEDELFLVLQGTLRMRYRDRAVLVRPGEFVIVPRGVEHCPEADDEVHVLLFEPEGTLNTGNVRDERTVDRPERI